MSGFGQGGGARHRRGRRQWDLRPRACWPPKAIASRWPICGREARCGDGSDRRERARLRLRRVGPGGHETAFRKIESELGPIDVADQQCRHPVEQQGRRNHARRMAASAFGQSRRRLLSRPARRSGHEVRERGRIVNTCSLAMKSGGLTAGTAYTTSKGALAALTFSLARETASFGDHRQHDRARLYPHADGRGAVDAGQRDALLKQIPVGRFCEPEEFAHCVRFFLSPLSGFITGEILDLNAGLHFD